MKPTDVTVLIPCHGKAPFLQEAVRSVIEQNCENYEILIVLDRPSTDTIETLENFMHLEENIRFLSCPTPGISAALNFGILNCTSEFIARIDADDVMEPTRLKEQIKILRSNSDIVCVGSQISIIDEQGKFLRKSHFPTKPNKVSQCLRIRNVMAHPSVMMRRSTVIEAGLYRDEWNGAEDYDLWFRLAKLGRLLNIEQPLTRYRIHDNQVTKRNRLKQQELDNSVRQVNLLNTSTPRMLKASKEINHAIGSKGIIRSYHFSNAIFLSPRLSFLFVRYFLIPEILDPR